LLCGLEINLLSVSMDRVWAHLRDRPWIERTYDRRRRRRGLAELPPRRVRTHFHRV